VDGGVDSAPDAVAGDAAPDVAVDASIATCTSADVCYSERAFEIESRGCGGCGEQTRRRDCRPDCIWGGWSAWSACSGGDCEPGETQNGSVARCPGITDCGYRPWTRRCSDDCRWLDYVYGDCVAEPSCIDQDGVETCEGDTGCCEQGVGGCAVCSTGPCSYSRCTASGWVGEPPGCYY
jgi:hypothetical protein